MSHYEISYSTISDRKARDEKAIADIKDYLSPKQWSFLVALACKQNADTGKKTSIESLNMAFGFTGVSGYPFHAFCRKYRLADYIVWMTSGDDAQQVDKDGFHITEK